MEKTIERSELQVEITPEIISDAEQVSANGYWKLPAPKAFEIAFLINNYDMRETHYLRTIYLGLFLIALYGIIEFYNLEDSTKQAAVVRYGIIIPVTIIAVQFFKHPRFVFFHDWIISIAGVLICILIFTTRYKAYQEGQIYYYYGYLIVMCYINIVIQPKFLPALISTVIVCMGSLIFFYVLNLETGRLILVIFDSIFFIFLSLLSNYYIQLQVRKTYARKILEEKAKLKEQVIQQELIKLSNLDSLSKLSNRNFFDEAKIHYDQARTGVLFIDIDNFKQYNDSYGHLKGDDCIRLVAATINANVRSNDLCARYGGEEFIILMKNSSPDVVKVIGQRIIKQVAALDIQHNSSSFGVVTVSIGWSYQKTENSLLKSIKIADEALYKAKESGKNCLIPA